MAQDLIEKRQRRRRRLRSFVQRFVGVAGLSLALWQMAVVTGGSLNRSAEVQNQSPLTRQGMSDAIMPPDGETMVFKSNSLAQNVVVATSRGGGRRGKSVASSAPISAGERMRNKIVQLGSQSKSLAQDGVDRAINIYQTADPNKKVAAGIIGAAAVGVGIGVEVAGRGSNDEDDGEALSNTDKLRKDIMNEIDWYNERYGTKQATRASGPPDGNAELEGASEMSEIRKIDPQAQVKAILDNAKETERRARQARREGPGSITSPPSAASSGVDYSQVKGLSTKEGDGKSRAQLLIETTARMEQRAEAQRLEKTRQRDFAEEQEVRRLQENLKNRIDSFIAVTEAEEHNQGFGDRPGDQGRALKAEVSRLSGELDESRSKVALLQAELEEKKKIETLLRQEIDRLRRSA